MIGSPQSSIHLSLQQRKPFSYKKTPLDAALDK